MLKSLVDQLYNDKDAKVIKELFKTDLDSRPAITQAISSKLITDSSKIITSNPIDVFFVSCLSAKFADSEDECNRIAITIYQYYDQTNHVLPSLIEDEGLQFSSKCLIALSFYPQALEQKWKYHGAPKPKFYRECSKTMYRRCNQYDIAAHHEQWESFLQELFI